MWFLGSMSDVLRCGLSFYLDGVNSHLLLSLAGLVHCDTAPTLVKHLLRPESPAVVLPPSSGAVWQNTSCRTSNMYCTTTLIRLTQGQDSSRIDRDRSVMSSWTACLPLAACFLLLWSHAVIASINCRITETYLLSEKALGP